MRTPNESSTCCALTHTPYEALAQQVARELGSAETTLLSPALKASYDSVLASAHQNTNGVNQSAPSEAVWESGRSDVVDAVAPTIGATASITWPEYAGRADWPACRVRSWAVDRIFLSLCHQAPVRRLRTFSCPPIAHATGTTKPGARRAASATGARSVRRAKSSRSACAMQQSQCRLAKLLAMG